MAEISSFAIRALAREAGEALAGAAVEKAHQTGAEAFALAFKTKEGKKDLLIGVGKSFNATAYKVGVPQKPSAMAMILRKHLAGKRLEGVTQHNFDRVVTFDFGDCSLVLEMFSHGNLVVVDNAMKALFTFRREAWKDRTVARGSEYEYPKNTGFNPETVTEEQFASIFTGKDVVRSLVKGVKLGGAYAEEICAIAGVGKNKAKPDADDVKMLYRAMKSLLERRTDAVMQGGEIRPFALVSGGAVTKRYASMSEAADELLLGQEAAPKANPKLEKLRNRLAEQRKALAAFENEIEGSRAKAELIRGNYQKVSDMLDAFRSKSDLSKFGAKKEKDRVVADLSQ